MPVLQNRFFYASDYFEQKKKKTWYKKIFGLGIFFILFRKIYFAKSR